MYTPETIAVVASEAGAESVDADHAVRNVLDDLENNRPYTITHFVHTEVVEAPQAKLREAFELAKH